MPERPYFQKDLNDLPLLEDFCEEFEQTLRGELKTSVEIALDRTEDNG
jgi:hypothetical protein